MLNYMFIMYFGLPYPAHCKSTRNTQLNRCINCCLKIIFNLLYKMYSKIKSDAKSHNNFNHVSSNSCFLIYIFMSYKMWKF